MNLYKITLYNKLTDAWEKRTTEKLSFPEASVEANLVRHNLGLDWEIVSIYKNNNEVKKNA